MITEVRLDERLIHGQTLATWVSSLKATHILLVSKKAQRDPLQKSALKMATTGNYKLLISDAAGAADTLNDPRSERLRIFVICETPEDVWELCERLPSVKEVNLAGYGYLNKGNVPGRKEIVRAQLMVDAEELEGLKKMERSGVKCVIQVVPQSDRSRLRLADITM